VAQTYELNLRDYLRILRKRYRVILALTLLCGAATLLVTPHGKPAYEADASVKVTHQSSVASLFVDAVTWSWGDDLATQSQIIGSLPMALKVGQEMGRFPKQLTAADLADSDKLAARVAAFKSLYHAEPVSGTSLIKIIAASPDADLSVHLANTVVDTFIREHTYERNRQIIESRKFIESQLADYQKRLRNSEAELTLFKKSHLTSLSLDANEMGRLSEKIENDDRRIRALSTLSSNIEARLKSADGLYVDLISGGVEDPAVQELNDELVRLQLERERMLFLQNDSSPEVAALEHRIRTLARRLNTEYRATEAHLQTRRDELAAKLASLPENDAHAARLAREVKVNEDTYTLLKQRYQEALIKEAEKVQEVSVVEYAADAEPQSSPGLAARTLAGLAVGLLLGLLAAFVRETLDTSIDTIEDVEDYLQVPVVGIIPHFDPAEALARLTAERPALARSSNARFHASVVTRHDRRSPVAEAYRTLRTNLQFAELRQAPGPDRPASQVFLVTSSSSGEGKTTTAANLAVVMAQAGKRVLLFDCDMRNPQVDRFFGVERSPGFTDVVLGSLSLDDAIRSSTDLTPGDGMFSNLATEGLDGLHLLTSGTRPPHPAEILISARFDDVLNRLRARFDVILLDSPPILPVTDAAILGSKVDGVVLVHQLGRIGRNALRRSRTLLDNVRARIWGIVLNDLRANVTGYTVETAYPDPEPPAATARRRPAIVIAAPRPTWTWIENLWPLLRHDRSNGHGRDSNTTNDSAPPPEA
jgi:succinoglycan biosynthesis transport protein ExoP